MLRSCVDLVDRHRVAGWARDDAQPDAPLSLIILDNEALVARVLANHYRPDLAAAGIGSGRHGFRFEFPTPLALAERHIVQVCREADGVELDRSPVILEPAPASSGAARELLARLLAEGLSDEELARSIDFMIEHVDKAVQRLADRHSGRAERAEHRLFIERWKRWGLANDAALAQPQAAAPAPRALIIDDRLPQPDQDAGSGMILSHIRSLQRFGFAVSFVAALEFAGAGSDDAALEALGVVCCGAPYYGSVEEVLRRQAGEFDVVYLHRIANAAKYGELVRHHFPKARLVYSVADLHHLRIARQAAAEDRPELTGIANRLRLLEFAAAALADAVITHSSAEAGVLAARVGSARVHMVRWSAAPRPTKIPFARRNGVAFIGGFGDPANLDAARWLVADIMPLVRQHDPAIQCLLVGGGLPDDLVQLCGDGVVAAGAVHDLAKIFDRVRLTVAPLRYGAGIACEVVASLAAGVPCVMTPIAREGLDLPDPLKACLGATAADVAAAVHRLHSDKHANQECRKAGLSYIESVFSEPHLDAAMRHLVDRAPV
jgi:glycosyltransferase involved in cell wall biosynthesis